MDPFSGGKVHFALWGQAGKQYKIGVKSGFHTHYGKGHWEEVEYNLPGDFPDCELGTHHMLISITAMVDTVITTRAIFIDDVFFYKGPAPSPLVFQPVVSARPPARLTVAGYDPAGPSTMRSLDLRGRLLPPALKRSSAGPAMVVVWPQAATGHDVCGVAGLTSRSERE